MKTNNPLPFEIRKKGTSNEEIASQLAQSTPKIYVEKFPKLGNETDDTARIQRAFDSASEGAEVIFDPKVHYHFKSVVSEKSLIVNFNGANLTVNPYATQTPAIWFKGSVGTSNLLTADVAEKDRVINVVGASSLFQPYDYVIVGDNHVTQPWASGNYTYSGRYEINMVYSVGGDTITLLKPIEWAYAIADGSFVQKVTKMINQPKILNSGIINEVDPGVESLNSPAVSGKGHIFQFQYCLQPKVENCSIDGWQMHVVNLNFCIQGVVRETNARIPFRPSAGGHGYFVRDDNSTFTIVEKCQSLFARHMVDWSRSYDGISRDNLCQYPSGTAFYTHGTGVKRCQSIDDKVIGSPDSIIEGWAIGDPGFNADYDCTIINPTYIGGGCGIAVKVGSKGAKVINPWILTRGDFALTVNRGAKDFVLEGGQIENYNTGALRYAILVDITTGGSTPVEYPSNIRLRGTKIKGNSIVKVEAIGTVIIEDLDFDVNITTFSGSGAAIRVCETQAPTDLIIRRNKIKGAFDRGIYGSVAPTGRYIVQENDVEGYRTGGTQLRGAGNLRFLDNTVVSNGSTAEQSFSPTAGSVSADINNGMVIARNFPDQTKAFGTYTFSGNGTNTSFAIPHTLIATPKRFSVVSGNAATGDAEIRSVAPFATNLTVAFKTAPVSGTSNMTLYWWAEC
jgi:hypothetical protein